MAAVILLVAGLTILIALLLAIRKLSPYFSSPKFEITVLETSTGGDFRPTAINNQGTIVGSLAKTDGLFLWDEGELAELGTLGGKDTHLYAINEKGQAVGSSTIANGTTSHAFLWSRETGDLPPS